MKKFFFILCILISFFATSCFLNREKEISLDKSDPLALAVDVQWAVVTDPYATFKTDKEWTAKDSGHAKKGDILKVTGVSISSEKEKWIRFSEGYLPAKSVNIYTNKYQADKASRELK